MYMQPVKLIILDRDGVINCDSASYIKSPDEWVPIPGALEAIATLKRNGWTVAIATNQSGIARGLFSKMVLFDQLEQRYRQQRVVTRVQREQREHQREQQRGQQRGQQREQQREQQRDQQR